MLCGAYRLVDHMWLRNRQRAMMRSGLRGMQAHGHLTGAWDYRPARCMQSKAHCLQRQSGSYSVTHCWFPVYCSVKLYQPLKPPQLEWDVRIERRRRARTRHQKKQRKQRKAALISLSGDACPRTCSSKFMTIVNIQSPL